MVRLLVSFSVLILVEFVFCYCIYSSLRGSKFVKKRRLRKSKVVELSVIIGLVASIASSAFMYIIMF